MFYAISKRRRDINTAKAKARNEVLNTFAARLQAEPDASPTTILAELRAQFINRPPR